MSVALIYNDGVNAGFSSSAWTRRNISSNPVNQGDIVKNFKIDVDTFELETGTYRFDAIYMGGMSLTYSSITPRSNVTKSNATQLFSENNTTNLGTGIATYQRLDTSGFTAGQGYLVGTTSALGIADTFTLNDHQLAANDEVFFTAPVPSGITAGQHYFVMQANLTANVFKVSATQFGTAVNFTGNAAPLVWKAPLPDTVQNSDYRPTVARCYVTVPVGQTYRFSIQNAGAGISSDGAPHGVTATLGGAVVPSRYLTLRVTKTD